MLLIGSYCPVSHLSSLKGETSELGNFDAAKLEAFFTLRKRATNNASFRLQIRAFSVVYSAYLISFDLLKRGRKFPPPTFRSMFCTSRLRLGLTPADLESLRYKTQSSRLRLGLTPADLESLRYKTQSSRLRLGLTPADLESLRYLRAADWVCPADLESLRYKTQSSRLRLGLTPADLESLRYKTQSSRLRLGLTWCCVLGFVLVVGWVWVLGRGSFIIHDWLKVVGGSPPHLKPHLSAEIPPIEDGSQTAEQYSNLLLTKELYNVSTESMMTFSALQGKSVE
ncbi:hypothetical protein J6590_018524 [Homalodisca vitripennis]|nr:hypothetical protein J6590_018524 [Homalodisca vitripennis]